MPMRTSTLAEYRSEYNVVTSRGGCILTIGINKLKYAVSGKKSKVRAHCSSSGGGLWFQVLCGPDL